MANTAFELGWQTREKEHDAKRQRREALEDEARQLKVKDLWEQRNAIRENLSKLGAPQQGDAFQAWAKANPDQAADYQQGVAAIQSIQSQLDDIHDPVKNPGALQRDFEFIKRLITRRPAAAPATPAGVLAPGTASLTAPVAAPAAVTAPAVPTAPAPAPAPGLADTVTPAPAAAPATPGGTAKVAGPGLSPVETMAVPPSKIKGLVAPGNLPIWNRPVIKNADGSISSEFSTSFTDENPRSPFYGKEVLVPTVVNGKFLTPDGTKPPAGSAAEHTMMENARAHYEQTGEHLGVFDAPASADKYAQALHRRGEKARPDAAAYQTPQQRQQQARQQRAQQEAAQFLLAGPQTPEQAAEEQLQQQLAKIKILDKLPGLTDAEKETAKTDLIFTALGITKAPKYFSQPIYTTDPQGKVHAYRVPQDPRMPAEEIVVGEGEQPTPKTSGGRAAKGLVFDKVTGSVKDQDTGRRYFRDDPNNPPEVKQMFAGFDRATAATQAFTKEVTRERGEGYNESRLVNVIDTSTGASTTVQYSDFKQDPSRYIVASEYDKWSPRVNMLEDLRGSSRIVRDSIKTLKAKGGFDFEGDVRTALFRAMTDAHPRTAVDQLIATGALSGMSQEQQKYVIATASMIEQAMGMRTILGAGQGSDDVRNAIVATIPSLLTPSPEFALSQMDMFDGTLERVHRMIPSNIRLLYNLGDEMWTVQDKPSPYSEIEPGGGGTRPARRGAGGAAAGGGGRGGAAGSKGGRSIGKVKAWMQSQPQWKGKTVTDQMATDYILSQHYTPTSP